MKSAPEKFTVIVRIRPPIPDDYNHYNSTEREEILETNGSNQINILRKNNQEKIFRFNHVYQGGTQLQVYQNSSHLIDALFEGYNSTFIAYGQTGTGKTYTIFGNDQSFDEKGMLYRSVENIFSSIKNRMKERQFAVRVSFAEFYMDSIYDLMDGAYSYSNSKKLEIKENSEDGIHISNLTQIPVKSVEEVCACLKQAIKMRKTEETSINKRSSRSHAVIQLVLLQRWNDRGDTKYLKGILKIVDLAGSERVSKTESFGSRLEEAKRINKEITTLGKCINLLAMAEKQNKQLTSSLEQFSNKFNFANKAHIPFRDSKITRFLSESLEGKSKIILCVCISKLAVHLQQSFSSLIFASQASILKIDSKKNQSYLVKKVNQKANDTAIKSKSEYKKTIFGKDKSIETLKREREEASEKNDGLIKTGPSERKLIEKFKKEMKEIQDYMQTKSLNPTEQSKQVLEANLIALNKIFNIHRSISSEISQENSLQQ